MCLLTVFPMPDLLNEGMEERLRNGGDCNPDGHGWAVVSGDRILTGKSMALDEAIIGFRQHYREATGPAMFHSRWATHGTKDLSNVHPFPVRKLRDTYVAHNGILPASAHPMGKDSRSDTRIFADDILPIRYKRLDNPNVRANLHGWLKGNKIAVLTTNPRFQRNLYVFGMEHGEWKDGVWFSNGDHEGWSRYFNRHTAAYVEDECLWCHAKNVNNWAICETCGTCQDCFEPQDTCQCFSPTGPDGEPEDYSGPLALEKRRRPDEDEFPTVIGNVGYNPALAREFAKPQCITDAEVVDAEVVDSRPLHSFDSSKLYRWPDAVWKSSPAPMHDPVKECFGASGLMRCGGNHITPLEIEA